MKRPIFSLLASAGLLVLASCSTSGSKPSLDAKTAEVLDAMSARLTAAKTLRATATRTATPGFFAGDTIADEAEIVASVSRPNQFAAMADTNLGKRVVGYDGKAVTLVDLKAGTHAQVAVSGDLDDAVDRIHDSYGFVPPLAELLANDLKRFLLDGVTSGTHAGRSIAAGVMCDHLVLHQEGLTWELWVDNDHLPRRMIVTWKGGDGAADQSMSLTVRKWELNPPLSSSDLGVKVPSGSRLIDLIPIGN